MPPRAAAEVAVATSVPLAAVDLLVEAAPQALRVSAATTARPPVRTAVLGRNTVTGFSPEGVHRGSHRFENLSEQVGPSRPVAGVRLVNFGETVTSDSPDNSGARGSLAHLVYSGHAVHSIQVGEFRESRDRGSMPARHEEIAEELRRAIDREDYAVGSLLPAETELAARYGVSRGTVRQAVAALTADGLIGSRQGARRVVLSSRRSQSFAELRSFAEWARAMGREATGNVVLSEYRPATQEDSVRLQLTAGTPVLHVLR